MASIYFADDEKEIRDIVTAFLVNDGYEVSAFETGDDLLAAFMQKPCDLVLLDIMMPGTDGIGILTSLRRVSTVPVILLTAKDTDSDYYSGLALGSDDYVTKPFKPMILLAKIRALLRRVHFEQISAAIPAAGTGQVAASTSAGGPVSESAAASTSVSAHASLPTETNGDLQCGNLCYASRQHACMVGSRILPLTPTELRFLVFMMGRFDEAVARERILDGVWGIDFEAETRVVDETNRRLRKKMTDAGADVYVQTVWGFGFKLTHKDGMR